MFSLLSLPAWRRVATALVWGLSMSSSMAATTLIRDVTVFDGDVRLASRNILLRDGKIADVDFHGDTPSGAVEVRCDGCTLLPGLIDSHVHAFSGREVPLLFGVTTQLDMFMGIAEAKPVKARMASGTNTQAADLFTAGTLVTAPGGHGTEYGIPIPTLTRAEDADAFVKARIDEGSDYIKLIYDGGAGWGGHVPTLDLPTLTAAIAAAHRYHKLAVVHVQDSQAAREAVAAGADGLMHLFADKPADAAFVQLAREHGVFVVPTYAVLESFNGRNAAAGLLAAPAFQGLLDASQLAMLQARVGKLDVSARLDHLMHDSIGALKAAGVPILAGTDAGNPGVAWGISLHRELELLVQAGLTPTEALRAATSAPAAAFHLADRGRIAPGLLADVVLVKGDPTQDIRATRQIVDIWKDGERVGALRQARMAEVQAKQALHDARAPQPLPVDGLIGTFDQRDGKLVMAAPFGRWETTTDAVLHGKSQVDLRAAVAGSLALAGEIKAGAPFLWAGVMYIPGADPVNLSQARAVRFKVRGDGRQYQLQAFCESGGYVPAIARFVADADWHEVSIPLENLTGFDAKAVTALSWVASTQPGPFHFEIRDVMLVAR